MPKDPTVYIDLKGRFEEFESRIKALEADAGKSGERAGTAFSGAYKAGLTLAAGAAVALAGTVATVAASTVQLAQESTANVNKFEAQLGKTKEEAEALGAVAERVFGNNFGGSLSEAGDAVAAVAQQIEGLSDTQLQKLAEGAIAIKDNFGTEVPESVSAAKTLMEQFGLTSQEAMDFLAKGYQEGLDRSGDFLDSINEYSTQFANGGASADEFWNIMKNGAQGGALGTDKAADAFKEFRVRIQDGSKSTAAALDEIGLSSEDMAAKMASGQMTAADAFKLVQDALSKVDNENVRMQAGVALLGTQYEDLGQKGAASLKMTGTSLKDMAGATDNLNAKYNTFGDLATGMWRKVQVALLPVGKELLGMANEAVPYLTRAFDGMAQKLPGMIKSGIETAKQFGTTAVNVYNSVRPAIDATITTVQKLSSFIERNKEVIIPLTAAVAGSAAAFALYRAGIVAVTAVKAAWTVATTTATAASVAFRAAITFLTGPIGIAITVIGLLIGAGVALYRNWDEVKAWAEKTWGRIKAIVQEAIGGAMNYLKTVDMKQVGLDIVMGLVNGILSGPRLVLAAARGLGNAVISGVKSILNIQSPSRVMQELGEFTSDGFVKGIESRKPRVIAAAKDTAKGFLEAFKELKLEHTSGLVDLGQYIKTLEQSATVLKAKMATVKEGTPAYREWLTALSAVQSELTSVKGKSSETASAAGRLNDEIKKGREQIAHTEGMERYVQGLRSATDQQLKLALATAKQNGDVERYNVIREEQTRRTEVATRTQDKNTEAENKAKEAIAAKQKQLADNRAQIAANEAQERYVLGLRSATDAQLTSALETARSRGEIEKYNSIKAEQKRRLDDTTAAQEKARAAAEKERQAVEDGRKAIADARVYESWKAGLVDLTDQQLAQAAASAEAAGNQSKYNELMAETKRRASEAADAVAAYAQGLRDSSDALDDVLNNPLDYADGGGVQQTAQADAQTRAAATRRQVYSDLYDYLTSLDDATINNAEAMEVLDGMLQNTAKSGAITSDELKILQGVLRDLESEADQLARGLEDSEAALNSVLASPVGERTFRPDPEAAAQQATFQNILDTLLNLDDATIQNSDTMAVYADMIENAGKNGAVTADQLKYLKIIFDSVAASVDAMNQGLIDSEEALKDVQANPVGEGTYRPDPKGDAQRETFENLRAGLRGLDLEALKNASTMKLWGDMIDNAAKSGALTTAQAKELTEHLARLRAIGESVGDMDVLPPSADDSRFAKWVDNLDQLVEGYQAGAITGKEFATQVFTAVPALERLADAAEKNSKTELAGYYRTMSAELVKLIDPADATAYSMAMLAEAQRKVGESSGEFVGPNASMIAGLEKLRGAAGVNQEELEKLIAKLKELDAQAKNQKGIDDAISKFGKLSGDLRTAGEALKGFGADSEVVDGVVGYMAGGVEIFGKFLSGDFVGMIKAGIDWLQNLGNMLDNFLVPGIKEWKKSLLEVADAESKAASAGTGMFKNVYAEMLKQDAAARQKLAGMNFFQRWLATLTGNLPQVMDEATAKLKISAAEIYADLASTLSTGLDTTLMNAFEEGAFTGTEKAIEKSMNSLLAKMALKAMVMASRLEEDIQAYAEERAKALEDGVISEAEQATLTNLWGIIMGKKNAVVNDWQALAPTLPGFGQNAQATNPADSITPQQVAGEARRLATLVAETEAAVGEAAWRSGEESNQQHQARLLQQAINRIERERQEALAQAELTAAQVAAINAKYDQQRRDALNERRDQLLSDWSQSAGESVITALNDADFSSLGDRLSDTIYESTAAGLLRGLASDITRRALAPVASFLADAFMTPGTEDDKRGMSMLDAALATLTPQLTALGQSFQPYFRAHDQLGQKLDNLGSKVETNSRETSRLNESMSTQRETVVIQAPVPAGYSLAGSGNAFSDGFI